MKLLKTSKVKLDFKFWLEIYGTEGICGSPTINHDSNWNEHKEGFWRGEVMCHLSPLATTKAVTKIWRCRQIFSYLISCSPFLFPVMGEHLLIFGADIKELLCLLPLLSVSVLGLQWSSVTGAWVARVCRVAHRLPSCWIEALSRTESKSPGMKGAEQARSELVSRFLIFFLKNDAYRYPHDT